MFVLTPNKPEKKHLERVKEEMKKKGAPEIRAVHAGYAHPSNEPMYHAIEGSHRLHAAHELGIKPRIKEVRPHEIIKDHDYPAFKDVPAKKIIEHQDRISLGNELHFKEHEQKHWGNGKGNKEGDVK